MRAAERFALFTNAAKPANPFEEEPAFDTFASAIFLTRSGDWIRRRFLAGGGWSVTELSLSEEERVGVGLATRLPFPLTRRPERRCIEPTGGQRSQRYRLKRNSGGD